MEHKMEGKGMKMSMPMKKIDMGVGQHPHSNKDPKGKGQEPQGKTTKEVYKDCTGVCDRGF